MALRVLHVLDHSCPVLDGYSQRSRSIVNTQKQLGIGPTIVTSPLHQRDDPAASDTSLEGIPCFRTFTNRGISHQAIRGRWPILGELGVVALLRRRIDKMLDSGLFDIVHAHSPCLCGLAAWLASRPRRVPFVYEIRSFWEDSDLDPNRNILKRLRYQTARKLETFVISRADAVVGIAGSILQELESRGVPRDKLFHVPNGVDLERFTPRPRDLLLATKFGVDSIPTLGFIGTLFPWEGVSWLVEAVSQLYRDGSRFKLLIVGDGAEGSAVRKKIQNNGGGAYVSFLGRVDNKEIERYYSLMDIMVYPRLSSRITELVTPLKPLEAMALSKAVLGSAVGGIRELIEPEISGMLFQPGDIADFCRQASRLLQEPGLRRALGERARQKMIGEKAWEIAVGRYETVYEAAIRNSRACM